jgi:hypothetical protein
MLRFQAWVEVQVYGRSMFLLDAIKFTIWHCIATLASLMVVGIRMPILNEISPKGRSFPHCCCCWMLIRYVARLSHAVPRRRRPQPRRCAAPPTVLRRAPPMPTILRAAGCQARCWWRPDSRAAGSSVARTGVPARTRGGTTGFGGLACVTGQRHRWARQARGPAGAWLPDRRRTARRRDYGRARGGQAPRKRHPLTGIEMECRNALPWLWAGAQLIRCFPLAACSRGSQVAWQVRW